MQSVSLECKKFVDGPHGYFNNQIICCSNDASHSLGRSGIPMDFLPQLACCDSVSDPDSCSGLVHSGPTHCLAEFLQKLLDTGKVAGKLYVVFHMIPFLMRLRKIKSPL